MIEAKANLSFNGTMGFFMAGIRYQVDWDDPRIKALVAGGYLTPTGVKEDDDDPVGSGRTGSVSDHSVVLGVGGPAEEEDGEVDVQGGAESA